MRLEIGPGGKIIGTKRVSPNGQVSGLSDYAGREVLIVLLEEGGGGGPGSVGNPAGWSEAVNEQMRSAFDQYQSLQDLYASPWEATRAFLQSVFPWAPVPDLTDQVNRWIETQVRHSGRGTGSSSEDDGASRGSAKRASGAKPASSDSRKKSASSRRGGNSA
jgi:hypothetical protein